MTANAPDRRMMILQATLDLVSERGLMDTPISLIAKRANSSPGILYHYFASKDEIVHSLYEVVLTQYAKAMMQANPFTPDRLAWYQHLWLTTFHYFIDHPKHASLMEQYKNSPYGRNRQSMEEDADLSSLVQMIEADIRQGAIKDLPLDVIYTLTVGVAVSLAKLQIAGIVHLDEATLTEIARTSCLSLQP